jgi:glycerol-3-phosphate acyltransferase PlsY
LNEILLLVGAYLLGSVPTGLLLARSMGINIRECGSGNIGATNVYRTAGKKLGIMTLIGDCLKGLVPILIAKALGLPPVWVAGIGLAAFLGHVYSVFLGFKGGKGVATALGVLLGTAPLAVLLGVLLFAGILYKWRYVSLASICAAGLIPALAWVTCAPAAIIGMAVAIGVVVIFKHHENIARLRAGTENKFKA